MHANILTAHIIDIIQKKWLLASWEREGEMYTHTPYLGSNVSKQGILCNVS